MIGSLGQPLLFLLALGYGFGPVFQKAGQGNYFEFLAPGVIAMRSFKFAKYEPNAQDFNRVVGYARRIIE